jgi:hypothetical protein
MDLCRRRVLYQLLSGTKPFEGRPQQAARPLPRRRTSRCRSVPGAAERVDLVIASSKPRDGCRDRGRPRRAAGSWAAHRRRPRRPRCRTRSRTRRVSPRPLASPGLARLGRPAPAVPRLPLRRWRQPDRAGRPAAVAADGRTALEDAGAGGRTAATEAGRSCSGGPSAPPFAECRVACGAQAAAPKKQTSRVDRGGRRRSGAAFAHGPGGAAHSAPRTDGRRPVGAPERWLSQPDDPAADDGSGARKAAAEAADWRAASRSAGIDATPAATARGPDPPPGACRRPSRHRSRPVRRPLRRPLLRRCRLSPPRRPCRRPRRRRVRPNRPPGRPPLRVPLSGRPGPRSRAESCRPPQRGPV